MRIPALPFVRSLIRGLIGDHEAVNSHPRYQLRSEKGAPGGYPNLDATGKVPAAQVPSGGGGAPADAEYLVGAPNATLTQERVITDTPTLQWLLGVPGLAGAEVRDESIGDAKLRQSAARSVIGRAFFDAGSPADIIAGVDGHVLRRSGLDIGFGLIPESSVVPAAMPASTLKGRGSAGGAGAPETISLGAGLTMTGTTLAASGGGGGLSAAQVAARIAMRS